MGCPRQILTDNGKVFTARFGPGPGPVRFDRICANNGITPHPHRAAVADHDRQGRALAQDAAPRVPRRQGVRLDRRRAGAARRVGAALQPRAAAPVDRAGAARSNGSSSPRRRPGPAETAEPETADCRPAPVTTRRVSAKGTISFAAASYKAGRVAGRPDRRGRLRRRARAAPSPRRARSPPTPAGTPSTSRPPGSQRGRRLPPVAEDRRPRRR